MKCVHCPIDVDAGCIGERARRLCDLIDPSHPAYQPDYRETIQAHPPHVEDPDLIIARVEAMAKQAPRGGGCCGG